MPVTSLPDWITEYARPKNIWYIKRLSSNDTLASRAHQAGPYIPKQILFDAFPSLANRSRLNPTIQVKAFVDSDPEVRLASVKWYNNKYFGGTRDETRVTGWGGGTSALLDPDSTGALAALVFEHGVDGGDSASIHVWVCEGYESEVIEDLVGPVDPGRAVAWRPGEMSDLFAPEARLADCNLAPESMPPRWLTHFPSPADIVRKAVELRPLQSETPDARLLRRRQCEFEIFKSVENAIETPKVAAGFNSLGGFLSLAQAVLQRRKSRSGRSLELHAREIFIEEGLVEDLQFSHGAISEGNKKPDFIFPSAKAYKDSTFPANKLRMLAAKTTARDRWRQVLNEADRIPQKHLLTLQEGVSENQFAEMEAANLKLVIPAGLKEKFPKSIQPKLMTLDQFIYEVRTIS